MDPKLIPTFFVAAAFDVLMPLVIGLWLRRRFDASWGVFGYGALVFFVSQMITRIPLVQLLQAALAPQLTSSETMLVAWLVFLSFSAGLFEETGRYIGYRYLIGKVKTWEKALMFGAGHGGLESMLLVGGMVALTAVQAVSLQGIDPSQMSLTPEQTDQVLQAQDIFQQMPWWSPLLGAYERVLAMSTHLLLSVVVVQVFLRGTLIWLAAAMGYHGIVNLSAVLTNRQFGPIWAEALLTVIAVLNVYLIVRLRRDPEKALVSEG